MSLYNLPPIPESCLNKWDIALLAEHKDQPVGFVWCGLMSGRELGYVDHFTIHPDYSNKRVAVQLAAKFTEVVHKLGVKKVFGVIGHHQYHHKSLTGALRMGMVPHRIAYTFVQKEIK